MVSPYTRTDAKSLNTIIHPNDSVHFISVAGYGPHIRSNPQYRDYVEWANCHIEDVAAYYFDIACKNVVHKGRTRVVGILQGTETCKVTAPGITEAEAMFHHMLQQPTHPLPTDPIMVLEEDSRLTAENLEELRKIIDSVHCKSYTMTLFCDQARRDKVRLLSLVLFKKWVEIKSMNVTNESRLKQSVCAAGSVSALFCPKLRQLELNRRLHQIEIG